MREQFTEVRNNSKTVKVIWQYVKQLVEDPDSPVDLVEDVVVEAPPKTAKGKGKATKRKRVQEEDEDEGGPSTKASTSKSRSRKAKVS